MENLLDLSGEVAFVSGASSGLGWHFAKTLSRAGATVVIGARRQGLLDQLANEVCSEGGKVHSVLLDVLSADSVEAAMDEAIAKAGLPTILVNNSGIATQATAVDMSEDEWDSVMNTNLRGTWLLSRTFARRLIEAKHPGTIVNIASILGLRVVAECPSYNASKAGIIHLTKSMALELVDDSIRVNTLCPGFIETEMNREFFKTEIGIQRKNMIPQKRVGQMQDLEGPLLLLASDASRFMTGSVLTVDGGHMISTL